VRPAAGAVADQLAGPAQGAQVVVGGLPADSELGGELATSDSVPGGEDVAETGNNASRSGHRVIVSQKGKTGSSDFLIIVILG
jgi:hypothetical protein